MFPHVLGVGSSETQISVRTHDGWRLVRRVASASVALVEADRFALIQAIDGGRPVLLAVRPDGSVVERDVCGPLVADAGGASASCVRCDGTCDQIEIVTYGDPRSAPRVRLLARPPDACASGVATVGGAGDIGWYQLDDEAPGIRVQCRQPIACAYLRLVGDGLTVWGQRDEPCPQ